MAAAVTAYWPGEVKVWDTVVEPLTPSGCSPEPSPQLTVTFTTGAVDVVLPDAVAAMVQLIGTPAVAAVFPVAPQVSVTVGGLRAVNVTGSFLVPAVTVITVVRFVVRLTRASPLASVVADVALKVPKSAEMDTGVLLIGLPPPSNRPAITVTVPPVTGMLIGSVRTETRSAAAVPTLTLTPPAELLPLPVRAGPENAWITAVPEPAPINVDVALPFTVGASIGSIRPEVVWNVTMVPLCTAVPDDSVTTAMTVAVPPTGSDSLSTDNEIVDPVGEVRGTRSHATTATTVTAAIAHRRVISEVEDTRRDVFRAAKSALRISVDCFKRPVKDNRCMELAGQPFDFARGRGERGYAMAALLVAMSVMAVLMSALLPVWTHMATREKEEELIFRGNQYARAIGLFQRKFANTAPPSVDVLVDQRFLRKKYKDPITNDDFQLLYANSQMALPGQGAQVAQRPGQSATQGNPVQTPAGANPQAGGFGPQGGLIGVTSKSKEASIKLYNGRSRYNEWAFVYLQTAQRPGQSVQPQVPGQGIPGGQGGRGQQPFGMPGAPGIGTPNRPPFGGGTSPFGQPGQFGQPQGPPPNQQNPRTVTPGGGGIFTPGQRPPGGR